MKERVVKSGFDRSKRGDATEGIPLLHMKKSEVKALT